MDETPAQPSVKARWPLSREVAIGVTILGLVLSFIYQMGRANQRIDDLDHRTLIIETTEGQVRELVVRLDSVQNQVASVRADLGGRMVDTERRQKEADDRLQVQIGHLSDLMERRFGPDGGK